MTIWDVFIYLLLSSLVAGLCTAGLDHLNGYRFSITKAAILWSSITVILTLICIVVKYIYI